MKFRKKPVVIEAFQFMGHEGGPDLDWYVAAVNAGTITRRRTPKIDGSDGIEIHTLEGNMSAGLRDWIIRGVKGEIYPCKPDIFEATYEPVALESSGPAAGICAFPDCGLETGTMGDRRATYCDEHGL